MQRIRLVRLLQKSSSLSSRLAISLMAVGFLLAGGVSCQDPAGSQSETSPPVPENEPAASLRLLGWSDYFPEGLFERFHEVTGIEVEYVEYNTTDELMLALQSPRETYDLVLTDELSVPEVQAMGRVAAIDLKRIPNFKNLDMGSLNPPWDPANQYTVPYLWGTTLIAYNRDLVPNPGTSWRWLWENASPSSPVYMMDEVVDLISVGMLSAGNDLNDQRPEALGEAVGKLESLSQRGLIRFASFPRVREALVSGECAAAVLYSSDAAIAAQENERIAYFVPEEGAPRWMDSFLVLEDCRNRTAAHGLIDYILRAEIGAQCAEYCGGGTPNLAALGLMEHRDLLGRSVGLEREDLERRLEFMKKRTLPGGLIARLATVLHDANLDAGKKKPGN